MILSLEINDLINYVDKQIDNMFPDGNSNKILEYKKEIGIAIERLENCFEKIKNHNYCKDGVAYFNHLHSDQYTMLIWFLSNTIWKSKNDYSVCNKLFYLNKALNGFSCMYDTELPDVFLLLHTVGTVLGRAKYSNYFIATQGCTVGTHKGIYPQIGSYASLLPNSSVIGDCVIGENVSIGINARVYNTNVEDNMVVFVDNKGVTNCKSKEIPWSKNWFK